MQKIVACLRQRGTGELVGQCLPENSAMAALARRVGFTTSALPEMGTVEMRLALR